MADPTPPPADAEAAAEALRAELEVEREARRAAEEALEAERVENPTVPVDQLVWMRHGHGVAHEVNVGSEAYKRLVEKGAREISGPTDSEREVTDFAMLEKAKADSSSKRR